MYKVSIIVPIYNGENYIRKCFDSLVSQTLKDIQILLINDGSKDNSEKICLEYVKKHKNVEYFCKENGGSASARNLGIEHATGEYIGFVDSDDYVEHDMFEKMYLAAKSNDDADIVFNIMRDENEIKDYPFSVPDTGFYKSDKVKSIIFPELLPHPNSKGTFRSFDWSNCARIFKRTLINENSIKYYDKSRRCEDLCFAFECTIHAKSYYIMPPEKLYHYIPSETSKSRHYTKNMWESISKLMHYLIRIGEDYKDYDFSEHIQYCILYFCVIVIRNEVFGPNEPNDKYRLNRIQRILGDELCRHSLILSKKDIYNKEYTAVFKAMRSAKAKKIYNIMKWFAWKKKYAAPVIAKIHKR